MMLAALLGDQRDALRDRRDVGLLWSHSGVDPKVLYKLVNWPQLKNGCLKEHITGQVVRYGGTPWNNIYLKHILRAKLH